MRIPISHLPNVGKRKLYRRTTKTHQFPNGGSSTSYHSEETGQQEEYFYKTEIELTDLEAMADRAAKNKGGICKDGALRVTITKRTLYGEETAK